MKKIRIACVAFSGANDDIFIECEKVLSNLIDNDYYEISDRNPDVLFIYTGGSEMEAVKLINNSKHILILATSDNNGYAAASEIKAYCLNKNINCLVLNIDHEDVNNYIKSYITLKNAVSRIEKYKLGLIGKESEWLIASNVDQNKLKKKFGIELQRINWIDYQEFNKFEPNPEFISHFSDNSNSNLTQSSQVYNLLNTIITKNKLDAITVECFPLVRNHSVTACLSLSKFNDANFPAGCEGDIASATGKIIVKELTGNVPWMANLVSVDDKSVKFAHCTIATRLTNKYTINTHFETGKGTAIQGELAAEEVTIFRLNAELSKAYIANGIVIGNPKLEKACRTQVEIKLSIDRLNKLKHHPLGNHHLIIPGKFVDILEFFCQMQGIQTI